MSIYFDGYLPGGRDDMVDGVETLSKAIVSVGLGVGEFKGKIIAVDGGDC